MEMHADPNSPEYNKCDDGKCAWCEGAAAELERARNARKSAFACSEWICELEAALRDATNAQLEIETGWKNLALRKIVRCKETLTKIIEAERGRSQIQ